MDLKNYFSRMKNWVQTHRLLSQDDRDLPIDEQGLISPETHDDTDNASGVNNSVVVQSVDRNSKAESIEKLQVGFEKLVNQLEGINTHLNRQAGQQEELMNRMEKLPELLESFPAMVENQKQIAEQLLEDLNNASVKNQQFVDAVEKIPTETAKQSDALSDINHQLSAAAETDVQMVENFNKFNETLSKLDQSTISQRDGIMQMSKTFATSDRYLKYLMSRQNKRFMWMFITTIGVCVAVITVMTVIIVFLKR
ncbi:hypothetical protein ACFL3G_07705 [Planctomycetota bacterium]